jgi:hypothetical protein
MNAAANTNVRAAAGLVQTILGRVFGSGWHCDPSIKTARVNYALRFNFWVSLPTVGR